MARKPGTRSKTVADVDYVLDENASPIELAEDTELKQVSGAEQSVGGTGPANWWWLGLAGLAVIILVVMILQFAGGGAQTDVVPGTPVIADGQ